MKTFIFLLIFFLTAVTTNTRPRRMFSLGHQSAVSMVFSRTLAEKVPSLLNEGRRLFNTRIISNDDDVYNYFNKMKDYIV